MAEKGKFIVLDGGEGSGTTTVTKELVQKFGWGAVATREPGGSPYAEQIRNLVLSDDAKTSDAETQFALFWAARRDHIKKTIAPALADGKLVVCDRFDSSTYAYQLIAQKQVQLVELFWKIREHFLGEYLPDAYILLDVSAETGIARAKGRNEELNHFDTRKIEFHHEVNKGLKEFITTKAEHGFVVDAEQPLEKVVADTIAIVEEQLVQ